MSETVRIIEVAVVSGNVFVVFSDGRVTLLRSEEIYSKSVDPRAIRAKSHSEIEAVEVLLLPQAIRRQGRQ